METSTLQLPKELIEGAVKSHIAAAVASALGDKTEIIETAVNAVLSHQVDSKGNFTNRDYDKCGTMIDHIMNSLLKKMIMEVLQEELEKHRKAIKENLANQLRKKNSPILKQFANAMTDGLIQAATNDYRMTIKITPDN